MDGNSRGRRRKVNTLNIGIPSRVHRLSRKPVDSSDSSEKSAATTFHSGLWQLKMQFELFGVSPTSLSRSQPKRKSLNGRNNDHIL